MGAPGWPEFAACTWSALRQRICTEQHHKTNDTSALRERGAHALKQLSRLQHTARSCLRTVFTHRRSISAMASVVGAGVSGTAPSSPLIDPPVSAAEAVTARRRRAGARERTGRCRRPRCLLWRTDWQSRIWHGTPVVSSGTVYSDTAIHYRYSRIQLCTGSQCKLESTNPERARHHQ